MILKYFQQKLGENYVLTSPGQTCVSISIDETVVKLILKLV